LTFRFHAQRTVPWAKKGHEIAWQQFQVKPAEINSFPAVAGGTRQAAELIREEGVLRVCSGDVVATFSEERASLEGLHVNDAQVLSSGPRLQLWRGATDNDGLKLWTGQEEKPLGRWRRLGLPDLHTKPVKCSFRKLRDGSVEVTLRTAASGRGNWSDAEHVQCFVMSPSGSLTVTNRLRLGSPEMTDLPRVGIRIDLPSAFEELRYFGLGPWENYADRKRSALAGIHQSTVSGEFVPYIMPQENGHHTETRWVELSNADGQRIRVTGCPLFEFNATHHTVEDLYKARHTFDLQTGKKTYLYIDCAHRGLGGASCGPDTRKPYLLLRKNYSWKYSIDLAH
jgi:beta-galactosidase